MRRRLSPKTSLWAGVGESMMSAYLSISSCSSGGASCHVGYRSCFYRKVPVGSDFEARQAEGRIDLEWTETEKVFDPEEVYGDAPNPTIL